MTEGATKHIEAEHIAGLYLHVPFCKQACHYCNFHFSTSLKYKEEMVQAMLLELEQRQDYLQGLPLKSVYFGGGTPSLLDASELDRLFDKIQSIHTILPDAEITLEANPDDLSREKLAVLANSPINRLSIGIQSFSNEDLESMNRAHNAAEANQCIDWARSAGFDQLTIDLIYGSPTTSDEQWAENVEKVLQYQLPHISCYCLTVEPKTALAHFVKTGKAKPVDEAQAERQFLYLMNTLEAAGYEHYEISNFALPGQRAVHNSNYWLGKPYLGIGPAAHSYNGQSRQWNVANNARYIKHFLKQEALESPPFELETLTPTQQYNEYILTRLRTAWGVELEDLPVNFQSHFLKHVKTFQEKGDVIQRDQNYTLSRSGKLLADYISMELFV